MTILYYAATTMPCVLQCHRGSTTLPSVGNYMYLFKLQSMVTQNEKGQVLKCLCTYLI